MDVSLFDYELPQTLVAQEPARPRDTARLMLLSPHPAPAEHRRFTDLPELLSPGDLLVLNDTRVVPARLFGRKSSGGEVEIFVLEPHRQVVGEPATAAGEMCRCLLRASRRPRPGERIELPGDAWAEMVEDGDRGEALLRFQSLAASQDRSGIATLLERHGQVPLPPYIRRGRDDPRAATDRSEYQTVFACHAGAVAAPTAGLHFTPRVLADLGVRGIETAALTLHVGPGTFRPVVARRAEDHRLDAEHFVLPPATAAAVAAARQRGGRVIACGTTVVRVLEAAASGAGEVTAGSGDCRLYILPGHRFRVVDGLLTNFHLPRSTLLMLVCALAGREPVLAAYAEAVTHGYRFYSYGDAMLIPPGPRSAP